MIKCESIWLGLTSSIIVKKVRGWCNANPVLNVCILKYYYKSLVVKLLCLGAYSCCTLFNDLLYMMKTVGKLAIDATSCIQSNWNEMGANFAHI